MLSIEDAAKKLNLSKRRVQKLCEEGRIQGAQKVSNVWILPDSAKQPPYKRLKKTIAGGDFVSLDNLCNELGVSLATGRNWVKLNKLTPINKSGTVLFDKKYINQLKNDILYANNSVLKSRRNKNFISGNFLYKNYLEQNSKNIEPISNVVKYIKDNNIACDKNLLLVLICNCAIQLLLEKEHINTKKESALFNFLSGKLNINKYDFLFEDLAKKSSFFKKIINKYKPLFNFTYFYEQNNDVLGLLYISLRNIGERKNSGAYYTPSNVVNKLVSSLFKEKVYKDSLLLDPCCGTGNFLLQLPDSLSFDQIYAFDIDEMSVKITRMNMAIKYSISNKAFLSEHIMVQDYLNYTGQLKFDYILGNPPWGFVYSIAEKKSLKKRFLSISGNKVESFSLFLERSLSLIKPHGYISFVLPESILNVSSHVLIRKMIVRACNIKSLVFLGNAFDGVQCPAIIMKLELTNKPINTVGTVVSSDDNQFVIKTNRNVNENNFCFLQNDFEYTIIDKMNSLPNAVFLKNNSSFALGIVTGDNKKYLSAKSDTNKEQILKGTNIFKFKYTPANYFLKFNPKLYQQVAPTALYRAKEKILYRFVCNNLVFSYDDQQTLSLNSCNILIPKIAGLETKYVLGILNSSAVQFFYDKTFHSLKILRSHIESIPIPFIDKSKQKTIVDLINSLSNASDNETVVFLYKSLDKIIYSLYGIKDSESTIIDSFYSDSNRFLPIN